MSIDKLKIYKTPRIYTQEQLSARFKSGAYIIYKLDDPEEMIFNVYGYAPSDVYDDNHISADVIKGFSSPHFKHLQKLWRKVNQLKKLQLS